MAAAAGRTGIGGRDLRGAGLLLRGGRALGDGTMRGDLGRFLSSDATSRSKASAGGGATDGVGLRRFGFDSGRRLRGDSSESRRDFMLSITACASATGAGGTSAAAGAAGAGTSAGGAGTLAAAPTTTRAVSRSFLEVRS